MRWRLTPARRRGVEILDDRETPDDIREQSMADVVRANRLFGGARSALQAFRSVTRFLPRDAVLLDVGTGLADIPARAQGQAQADGVRLTVLGLDISEYVVRSARGRLAGVVVGDVLHLPLADGSVDVVICSQVLHHFAEGDVRQVLAELSRVSRGWVVISDLRRSWLAAVGFWVASIVLRFHAVTRHDGVISVLRGFTAEELETLVATVTGTRPRVSRGVFWRLSVVWQKSLSPLGQ
jgi:SAM-dependent methyltransferase